MKSKSFFFFSINHTVNSAIRNKNYYPRHDETEPQCSRLIREPQHRTASYRAAIISGWSFGPDLGCEELEHHVII